ncbi:hypothetical protein [Pseudonocardia sp. GCM10023141]
MGAPADIVTRAALAQTYGEDVLIVTTTAPDGTIVLSCVPLLG